MKKKTWLFIIVLIVFIINVSFFVLVRLAKVDKIVQDKISDQLSIILNAEIMMDEFSFNDNQVNVSGIEINSPGRFNLQVDQLYVEYNLPKLLLSKFKNLKAIKHIKIYKPKFTLMIKPQEESKEKNEFQIPDITEFFKKLDIYNGEFSISFENETLQFANKWYDINLTIENTKSSDITLTANSQNGSNLNLSCVLEKGNIDRAKLKLRDFKASKLQISPLKSLDLSLNAELNYNEEKLTYNVNIEDVNSEISEMKASIDSIAITGNKERAFIQLHNAVVDGNLIEGNAIIFDILSKDRSINSNITAYNIPIEKYIKQITGRVNTKIQTTGKLSDPKVKAEVTSEKLTAEGQELVDIKVTANMKEKLVELKLNNSYWEENLITGAGYYKIGGDFHFDLYSKSAQWQKGNLKISGDLTANINYKNEQEVTLDIENINIQTKVLRFNDLALKLNLTGNDFTVDMTHPSKEIGLSCFGNIEDKELQAKLILGGLDLSEPLNGSALPILNGHISVTANEYSIVLNSNIMVYDRNYGKLGGRLETDVVLDLSNKRSLINVRSYEARYNYELFKIDLLAKGTLDSIGIQHFKLNNMINIDGWIKRKPALKYNLVLQGDELKVKELSKYFVDFNTAQQLDGELNIDLIVDNIDEGKIKGNLFLNNLKFGNINEINVGLELTGDGTMLSIRDGFIKKRQQELIKLQGALILKPEMMITATGDIDSLMISKLLPKENLDGYIRGGIEFSRTNGKNELQVDMEVDKLKFNRFKADKLKFDILQKDSLLHVNEIRCIRHNEYDLMASGAIGYNILNSQVFQDTFDVLVRFEGDLLEILSDQIKVITEGRSKSDFEFRIGTQESKIFVEHGSFNLKNGSLKINDQPENIDKISIDINIDKNLLMIDKFKFRMGEGSCYISNIITNTSDDFILGTLNMGKILIKTNNAGILFNMPGYIPENNVAKVIIGGRNSEFFEIIGPFEDMKLIGDLNISNGRAIFPPNTENLLKLFNTVRKKKTSESVPLPLSFDIMVNFGENVQYVTYPVNIKINPGGYLNLVYTNEEFKIPGALFIAEEGSVDIFGTKMKLDYMQIQLSKFTSGAKISGTFYKKTADGSLITLDIYNEVAEGDELGTLRFSLNSDNPTDRITDILAKLRYNRTMEEISPDQKKTLLQDEVIQIAGMGLESAVMDPLLSPVENWVRQSLKLDYFHLQTDLVQNLFASYSPDGKSQYEFVHKSDEIAKFSSELFLNNLSISMGRYIARDLFFDYETRVEKSQNIALQPEMGIFHEFALRYQLPYKFRIVYRYKIMPFKEENPHEIMLERSFRF